jgi:hypothetical protein
LWRLIAVIITRIAVSSIVSGDAGVVPPSATDDGLGMKARRRSYNAGHDRHAR